MRKKSDHPKTDSRYRPVTFVSAVGVLVAFVLIPVAIYLEAEILLVIMAVLLIVGWFGLTLTKPEIWIE